MKRPLGAALLVCTALLLNSCGSGSGTTTKTKKIGFSVLELKNPFFTIISNELQAEAKQHGFEVIVHDAGRDVEVQAKHIDTFIAQRVTAIVLNPADRIAIGPAIKKANEAGIPVFTCDLQCVDENVEIAGHVGTDNYQGGKLAGKAMIDALGEGGGEVLVVHYKTANSCVLRVQGFTEVIEAHNKGRKSGKIEIVQEVDGGGLRDEGLKATAAALQNLPNLAGIFAINDPSGLGAWRALKDAGRDEQVKIVAFDGEIAGKQAIKDGKIYADPIQFPDRMGRQTMRNIIKYLNGEDFEKVVLFKTELYTKADAEKDPDLK